MSAAPVASPAAPAAAPPWRTALGWWLAGIAAVAIGIALRRAQLDLQILVDDEWHAVHKLLTSPTEWILRTFGFADHSIPLTLYYQWLALDRGLTEWAMRLPSFVAACALLLAFPLLLLRHSAPAALAITTGLLAVSPLAVHFAKLARPYALTMLLGPLAILAFHRCWSARHAATVAATLAATATGADTRGATFPTLAAAGWGAAYVLSAFTSAWLHPVTLPLVLAPLAYGGALALVGGSRGEWRALQRLAWLAIPLALLVAWVLVPPLLQDLPRMAAKTGADRVTPASAWRTVLMLYGTPHAAAAAVLSALAGAGALAIRRREPEFFRYLLACLALASLAVVLSGAAYIHHPLVLARYLLPMLPFLLWLTAEGAARLLPEEGARAWVGVAVAAATIAALAWSGPLPGVLHRPNQFIGHLMYQFDVDPEANAYARAARSLPVPAFYRELGRRPPMSTTIVEMPWRLESHYNPLPWYQEIHRQRVKIGMVGGVCGARSWGETIYGDRRVRFRHFVHLAAILAGEPVGAELLVVHRHAQPLRPEPGLEWPDMEQCLAIVTRRLGAPVHDDGELAVFRLKDNDR